MVLPLAATLHMSLWQGAATATWMDVINCDLAVACMWQGAWTVTRLSCSPVWTRCVCCTVTLPNLYVITYYYYLLIILNVDCQPGLSVHAWLSGLWVHHIINMTEPVFHTTSWWWWHYATWTNYINLWTYVSALGPNTYDECSCSVDWLAVCIAGMLCNSKTDLSNQTEAIRQIAQMNWTTKQCNNQ